MRKFWSISLILMIITLTSCGEKLTDEQLFTKANELAGEERFEEAITNFQKIFDEFPESNYREKALFMMGFLYANHLKNYEKARIAYEQFLELYPLKFFSSTLSASFKLNSNSAKETTTLLFVFSNTKESFKEY